MEATTIIEEQECKMHFGTAPKSNRRRVLVVIGSLRSGGKERRLVELLSYFHGRSQYEFLVVMTRNEIHYQQYFKLNIPTVVLKKRWKKADPTVITQLIGVCRRFKPHLIHSWGRMQSFYSLPAVIGLGIPLINSQITGAPSKVPYWSFSKLIDKLNFRFSRIVLANSRAGLQSFDPPAKKQKVIYNGINLARFENLPNELHVRAKYGIQTPFAVVMVASFTKTKNYDLFYKVASIVTSNRTDITFIGVGGIDKDDRIYRRMLQLCAGNSRILFPGKINDVEALVNACSIGVLFSADGEGISNSILEYMALGKPVIANNAGGTKELVIDGTTGYLIKDEAPEEIAALIEGLIDHPDRRISFGRAGRKIIDQEFSLEKMGAAFEELYDKV